MADHAGDDAYTRLGARPVINAAGSVTLWGGSNPSSEVRQDLDEGDLGFVEMQELLEKSGEHHRQRSGR